MPRLRPTIFLPASVPWVSVGTLGAVLTLWASMTQAVGSDTLRDFANMVNTELVVIDQDTTTTSFSDRLRWNQAYFRLAQGLR